MTYENDDWYNVYDDSRNFLGGGRLINSSEVIWTTRLKVVGVVGGSFPENEFSRICLGVFFCLLKLEK